MRSLSRDRSRLVLWLPAVKGRIIKSWFNHGSVGRPGLSVGERHRLQSASSGRPWRGRPA